MDGETEAGWAVAFPWLCNKPGAELAMEPWSPDCLSPALALRCAASPEQRFPLGLALPQLPGSYKGEDSGCCDPLVQFLTWYGWAALSAGTGTGSR